MFNIKSFRAALSALTAGRDERASTMASFLSDAVQNALTAQLIEGADAFNQLLNAIHASGKSSIASKLRKAIRTADWSPLNQWGHVALTNKGFSFSTVAGYIGGNSRKCSDIAARRDAIDAIAASVTAATMSVFAPTPAGEKAGPFDFLAISGESFAKKVSACDRATLEKARRYAIALESALTTAIARMADADADADAVEAEAVEAEAVEAEAVEAEAVEAAPAKPAKRQRRKVAVAA